MLIKSNTERKCGARDNGHIIIKTLIWSDDTYGDDVLLPNKKVPLLSESSLTGREGKGD